jgi:hypothetical protein
MKKEEHVMSANLAQSAGTLVLVASLNLLVPMSAFGAQAQKPPPGSVADTASKVFKSVNQKLEAADRAKFVRDSGFKNTLREADLAAAAAEEKRISERFLIISQLRVQKLDAKEEAVLRALKSVVPVNFEGAKFKEVIELLQEKLKVPLVVNQDSLREAMVEYDDPVNLKVPGKIEVRTLLRKVLGDRGLGYIVKAGAIQVVTAKQAREAMVTRSYPVGDLVTPQTRFANLGPQMALLNVQSLINIIMNSAGDPALWQQDGASIQFDPKQKVLIIRAPAELHYMMPASLGR